jgi:hypothetical protein
VGTQVDRDWATVSRFERLLRVNKNLGRHKHTLPLLEKGCVRVIFIPHWMVIGYTFNIINLFYFTKVRVLFRACLGEAHVFKI